jgi:RNA polymerase sigma-70 factor (ECF subfamily)
VEGVSGALAAVGDSLVGAVPVWYNAIEERRGEALDRRRQVESLPADLTDEELVARAQEDDQRAFEELVRRHQGKVQSIAYHMCDGNTEEARDLTQEAFLRAFRNLRKFRRDSSFYTWLYRIAVNTCLDSRRQRRRWESIFSFWRTRQGEEETAEEALESEPDPAPDNNPLEVLTGRDLSREIGKALATLPMRQRMAFQLKVMNGMNIREIAEIMGSAEGTVKSHLFRATRSLQNALKEWV